jgi:hypothetical protein
MQFYQNVKPIQQPDILYNFRRKRFVRESHSLEKSESLSQQVQINILPDPNDNLTTFYQRILSEEAEKRSKKRQREVSTNENSSKKPKNDSDDPLEVIEDFLTEDNKLYYCEICQQAHSDSPDQHKRSSIHMFNVNLQFEPPTHFGISMDSKGYQMLRDAFQWNEESGLGKTEQGRLFPLSIRVKRNRLGLGNPAEKKLNLPLEVVVKQQQQQIVNPQTNTEQKKHKYRLTKARKKRIEERKKAEEKRIRRLIYNDSNLTPEQQKLLYGT